MPDIVSYITPNNIVTSVVGSNANINAYSTSVAATTLAQLTDVDLAGSVNGSILIRDTNEYAARTISGACTLSAAGVLSFNPNACTLGTHTVGNYVASIAGTANQVIVTGSGSETANVTLSLPQSIGVSSSPTFSNLTLSGVLVNTDLDTRLSGKSAVGHTHTASDITNFNAAALAAAPVQSINTRVGAIVLDKSDVGLSNVDNTSDTNKPLSTATVTALSGKVNTVAGKDLSDENYTAAEKSKLSGIAAGAEVNVNADWAASSGDAQILNKPTTVAGYNITDAATITGATFSGAISATNLSGTNTGDQTITLTGDVTGSGNGSFVSTLKNVGTAGTYNNSATSVQPFTTDAAGRISSAGTPLALTPAWSNVTNTPTTISGYSISDAVTTSGAQHIDGVKTFSSSPLVPNLTVDSSSLSAVNKAYADNIATGIHVHGEAHLILKNATLAVVTGGTVAYTNGASGVGAKLTVTGGSTVLDALLALDADLVIGSRIIIAHETNVAHNGIYTISAARELTRATDADTPLKMNGGDFVFVTHGTTYANTSWIVSEPVTTVGTSPVIFLQFSGAGAYDVGNGLQRDGTIFSVKIPAGSAIVADANGINLGASGVTANTYGSATASAVLTVNDKGLVTSASTSTITPAVGSITGLGSGVGTFLGAPTSANLEAAITGATGSGALVFGTTPTLSSPTISTALTLNATTYTYGTNAATAHRTALSINNVDNTSDTNKPVSTATQSALDAKANLVDPVRTTLTGNGSTSVYAISGASGLVNPSALIVAIDGILQEPSVDYTVASGNITFTSPLPSGSKAVVISPTNSLQVSQNIPADGSVTSAKIVGGVTLSDPVVNNSITLNATNYVYGAGAADAHRTALGLASFTTLSPAELQSKVFSNSLLSSPLMSFFDDCDGRYGYTATQSGTGGSIGDSDNAGNLAYGVYRVITGAVSGNFYRGFVRIAGGVKAIGTTFQSIFTIQDITDCEVFVGLTWVGISQFGLAYRSGLDGGLFTFRHGGSNYATLPASTAAPQNGNFLSGKRYKFTMTQLTNTTSSVLIEEADFNNTTWTTLYSGVVTHGSRLSSASVGMCPSVEVTTKTNAQRAIFFDYLRFENAEFLR
jgi:hypothetical protein